MAREPWPDIPYPLSGRGAHSPRCELITWLAERPDAGILGLLTSLAGFGAVHDRRNGRVGDFDYQLTVLRLGGECGVMPDCFVRRLVPRQTEWARNRVLPKIGLVK